MTKIIFNILNRSKMVRKAATVLESQAIRGFKQDNLAAAFWRRNIDLYDFVTDLTIDWSKYKAA